MNEQIIIKYFDDGLLPVEQHANGDWIDLRAAEDVQMQAGDFHLIRLGVAMQLPIGYEAQVAPRSSTFKKYGILQANSLGVIDHSYCGDSDEWRFPAYAVRPTMISKNDRICQFRIVERQPNITFVKTEHLDNPDRGGFGSTGTQ